MEINLHRIVAHTLIIKPENLKAILHEEPRALKSPDKKFIDKMTIKIKFAH